MSRRLRIGAYIPKKERFHYRREASMESLRELFRIGLGPSSSHTMGPKRAAEIFRARFPEAIRYRVTLYGSLAATGRGHLTDVALRSAFDPGCLELVWKPEEFLPLHPNGMEFAAFNERCDQIGYWRVYSIGGGALRDETAGFSPVAVYPLHKMAEIMNRINRSGLPLWSYVRECESDSIWEYLARVWEVMRRAIERGLATEGYLPGQLHLKRKGGRIFQEAKRYGAYQVPGTLYAYALAVAEENASGGTVVAAPTCGSSGVLPAVLKYLYDSGNLSDREIVRALATAGLIGNLVKANSSISGAAVGCQGEIGTACAMAAAAAAQLLGGSNREVEYAAEMGMEHHLGLTCDPVAGLVQIPCIERNVFAAARAVDCAGYALLSGGTHQVSFDEVIETMTQTGADLKYCYRETSTGGLASFHRMGRKR
jgi:L-serine dehydratase